MKKIGAIILALNLVCLTLQADKKEAPPGMEIITIGSVDYVVPRGTKVKKKDGIVSLEGRHEYTARRFSEIEKEISELREKNKALEDKVKALKKLVDKKSVGKTEKEVKKDQEE
ncbi:MAG: hypothetical protein K9L84_03325 [Candidatus Omnitrophica bacterium]|nr:hypothetical protein [Candidatus Omnitrophota bacterium]MCF7894069.1 hypothetical protein [Candidatus Omnitrophota bacterium]